MSFSFWCSLFLFTFTVPSAHQHSHIYFLQEVETDYSICTIKADDNGSFGVLFNGARNRADTDSSHVGVFVSGTKPGSPASRAEGLEVRVIPRFLSDSLDYQCLVGTSK